MGRGEETLYDPSQDEQRDTTKGEEACLTTPLNEGLFPGEITGRQQGRPQQQAGATGNENGRQFDDAMGKNEGPKGNIQSMDVT